MLFENDAGSSSSSSSVELLNLTDLEPDLFNERSLLSSAHADFRGEDVIFPDSVRSRDRIGKGGDAGEAHGFGASSAFSGTAARESAGFVSVGTSEVLSWRAEATNIVLSFIVASSQIINDPKKGRGGSFSAWLPAGSLRDPAVCGEAFSRQTAEQGEVASASSADYC